jgi:hypothetical protein
MISILLVLDGTRKFVAVSQVMNRPERLGKHLPLFMPEVKKCTGLYFDCLISAHDFILGHKENFM